MLMIMIYYKRSVCSVEVIGIEWNKERRNVEEGNPIL